MIGILRFIGILNAAVWLGAAVFHTFGIGPALTSPAMEELLTARYYPYFSVALAQVLVVPYFHLQLLCGVVAVFHVVAEWLYLGNMPDKLWRAWLAGLIAANLVGGFWLQPNLKAWHDQAFGLNTAPEARNSARRKFRAWHSVAEVVNLVVLAGTGVYLWRMANPSDPTRFVSTAKFRS